MRKIAFTLIAVGLASLAYGSPAQAQYPNLDMSQMVQNELNFQKNFYQYAWKESQRIGRLPSNGQPLPFNAMTIHQSNNVAAAAGYAYIRNSQVNSNKTSAAIANWTNGAVRGVGPYQNPQTGQVYQMPWTANTYNIDRYGYYRPGYNPWNQNVVPYYGR